MTEGTFTTRAGEELFGLLPEEYRSRDRERGDLARYLDGLGTLLDRIHQTLVQRQGDCFPDSTSNELPCQPWLLPYLAELFDAVLRSPTDQGKREEIGHTVSWRQCKGTLRCIEEIVRVVGGFEVAIHEGFKRVATTPAIGREKGRTPHTLATTVDTRVPVLPDSSTDHTARLVDLRTPTVGSGLYHPRQLLLYVPTEPGFFPSDGRRISWAEVGQPESEHLVEVIEAGGRRVIRNISDAPLIVTDGASVEGIDCRIEGIGFLQFVRFVDCPKIELSDVAARDVVIAMMAGSSEIGARNCLFNSLIAQAGSTTLEYVTVLNAIAAASLKTSDCILPEATNGLELVRYSRIDSSLLTLAERVSPGTNTWLEPAFVETTWGTPGCGVLHSGCPDRIKYGSEDGGEMGAFHDRFHCRRYQAVLEKVNDHLPLGLEAVIIPDEGVANASFD